MNFAWRLMALCIVGGLLWTIFAPDVYRLLGSFGLVLMWGVFAMTVFVELNSWRKK
ncbi:MAG: hypothetical protein KDK08_05455 [Rhizobiaceae bacterium]|nr:hypothetical protein [Rhizobiaceae bacterium]MCC0000915.1 hypothetical protein [Methylobacteriaceae bacterium]